MSVCCSIQTARWCRSTWQGSWMERMPESSWKTCGPCCWAPKKTSPASPLPSWSKRRRKSDRDRCASSSPLCHIIDLQQRISGLSCSRWLFSWMQCFPAVWSVLFGVSQIEQEKIASLRKVDEDKKEKENRERAQSRSPRRLELSSLFMLTGLNFCEFFGTLSDKSLTDAF